MPVRQHATIDQRGDIGVTQRCQNSALVLKAIQDQLRIHTALDQLDGNLLLEPVRLAFAEINHPNAAAPKFADQAKRTDLIGRLIGIVINKQVGGLVGIDGFEPARKAVMGVEQRNQFVRQPGILKCEHFQSLTTFASGLVCQLEKQFGERLVNQ